MAPHSVTCGTRGAECSASPSAASLPITIEVEAGRTPEAVGMCLEMIKSRTGTQTPVFPARSLVDTPPQARYLSRFVQRRCPARVQHWLNDTKYSAEKLRPPQVDPDDVDVNTAGVRRSHRDSF